MAEGEAGAGGSGGGGGAGEGGGGGGVGGEWDIWFSTCGDRVRGLREKEWGRGVETGVVAAGKGSLSGSPQESWQASSFPR